MKHEKLVTAVKCKEGTYRFSKGVSRSEALRRIKQFRKNPVDGLSKALDKFEEFNWKPAGKISKRKLDLDVPFIRIGRVPVITYMSNKEGTMQRYFHETKRMPTLYMHPSKPVGVIVGGSVKVKEWLYD